MAHCSLPFRCWCTCACVRRQSAVGWPRVASCAGLEVQVLCALAFVSRIVPSAFRVPRTPFWEGCCAPARVSYGWVCTCGLPLFLEE